MRRIAALACLLAASTFLPVQAEAARFRGGRSGATTKTSRSIVIVPGAAAANRTQAAESDKPERVPFPPSSAPREEPVPLRLTANEGDQKTWCRTEVVVGGFCILN
ncbi:hypothetical protein AB4Z10_07355 [Bosea sp. RAF48]|uniref:hypothetical protein n=1 Tax=Bosea sp. RAF48 TaxID=3237480 RepID=UPI003F92C4B5